MNRPVLSFAQLRVLAAQVLVRQAPTIGVLEDAHEAIRVVAFAGVEAEQLPLKVAV